MGINKTQSISAYILAGGKSTRMGEDKGLKMLNNKPMIAYVLDQVNPCFEAVYIIANTPLYEKFSIPVLADIKKEIGAFRRNIYRIATQLERICFYYHL
jgi:molybdenum cofactor guanylyltransferase